MNYEEKLREIVNSKNTPFAEIKILSKYFPELKESGDKRNIKDLIEELKRSLRAANCQNDACGGGHEKRIALLEWSIAWLEKQGKTQVRTGVEWVNTIDNACDERYAEEYAHGEYCHEQSFKWGFQEGVDWLENQRKEWNADDLLKCNQIIDILQEYNRTELIAWLEKQGKQDALKGLPKWKKIIRQEQKYLAYGFLSWDDYYLSISELKRKLPKEK